MALWTVKTVWMARPRVLWMQSHPPGNWSLMVLPKAQYWGLFNNFIHHLEKAIECKFSQFAGNTRLGGSADLLCDRNHSLPSEKAHMANHRADWYQLPNALQVFDRKPWSQGVCSPPHSAVLSISRLTLVPPLTLWIRNKCMLKINDVAEQKLK